MGDTANKAIRLWFMSSLFWLAIGPLIGLLQTFQFLTPSAMEFLSAYSLSYGKIRVFHTNIVIYGWIATSFMAAILYIIPKLSETELKLPQLAYWAGWIWNIGLLLNIILIWAGIVGHPLLSMQPYEYAEAPMLVDIFVVIAAVMIIASVHLTVLKRKRQGLYVSVWYLVGGLYTTAITYLGGNFIVLAFTGLGNQILHAWWLHNAVGMFVTPLGVGIAYYLIPKASRQPLYSHRLSIIGFWTLMIFYPATGVHHFLQMPMPTWLSELAVISSVLLAIPVLAVVVNFLATPARGWGRVIESYPLRFAVLGAVFYLLTCIQGPFQATHAVNWYVHFTEWVQAHAHLALAGGFTCFGMAAGFYMFPRVTGKQLYSSRLASLSFWLMAIVFPLFYLGFTHSGLVTSTVVNLNGVSIYEAIVSVWMPRLFRTITGGGVVLAFLFYIFIILRSLKLGPAWSPGMNEVANVEPVAVQQPNPSEVPA